MSILGVGYCQGADGTKWEVEYRLTSGSLDTVSVSNHQFPNASIDGLEDGGGGCMIPPDPIGETATLSMPSGRKIDLIFTDSVGNFQVTGAEY